MSDIIKTENLTFSYLPDEGQEAVPALRGVELSVEQIGRASCRERV